MTRPAEASPQGDPASPETSPPDDPDQVSRVPARRAFIGAAAISLQPMLLSAVMLPVTAYVIRGLGPTGYGQWVMATTLVSVVTFLTNLGLRGAFVRSVARETESAQKALAEQIGVRMVLSLLTAVIAISVCTLMGYPRTVWACTAISALAMVLATLSTSLADLLQALQRLSTVAMVNLVAGLTLSAASLAVVWSGGGPIGVAASYLLGPVTSCLLLVWIVRGWYFPVQVHWNLRRYRTLLWNARFIASQQLVFSVAHHAEALIIPRLVGPTLFGFFSAGTLLADRLTALPEGLCSAAYPAIVSANRGGIRPALRVFFRFLVLVMLTSVGAAATVSFLAGPIAELLFPGRAQVSQQVMRITAWLLPSMGLHFILGYLLNALDKDAVQAKISLIASACNLGITATLVWNLGLIGACWSIVLRYVTHLVMQLPYAVWHVRRLLAEAPPPAMVEVSPAAVVPK